MLLLADTPSHFAMIRSPGDVMVLHMRVKRDRELTLLCVNDDITREDKKVNQLLQKMFSESWPTPAAWER